jgi:Flp pilus assembly protein TadG
VEFALIAPLFFLVLGGIVEFGQAFRIEHLLSNACRRGARTAILSGKSSEVVQASVREQCVSMMRVKGENVTVQVLVNGKNSDVGSAVKGDQIEVKVSVPFNKAGVGFFTNTFIRSNMTSVCIMEHE